jgi:hypothetical protein
VELKGKSVTQITFGHHGNLPYKSAASLESGFGGEQRGLLKVPQTMDMINVAVMLEAIITKLKIERLVKLKPMSVRPAGLGLRG